MATRQVSSDPFASPKRRLARAKSKLETLIREGKAFAAENPYSIVTEPGYACAIANGKVTPKNTYFPIADSAPQLETDVIGRGRCKDVPPDIVTLFRSFQPYKGGNLPIWALNRLANSNKHRLITPMGVAAEQSISINQIIRVPGLSIHVPRWDREKNEMLILSAPIGSNVKYDLNFAILISFDEIEPVAGHPVIPVLATMFGEVERILLATEAEARRIGLIG